MYHHPNSGLKILLQQLYQESWQGLRIPFPDND